MNPTTSSDELFTRAETLRGLPERRASLLLFLIECETMRHVMRLQAILVMSSPALEAGMWSTYFVADTADEAPGNADMRDAIGALKLARQGKAHPNIWEIERYAEDWRVGVPPAPQLRAATARLLAQKYHFTAGIVPGIRRSLGLDTPEVQAAFQALYHAPLSSIYAPQITLADHFARLGARFENALATIGRALQGGGGL